jgi:DnaJ-domain-containing protein 1
MARARLADYSDPVGILTRSCDHPGCTGSGDFRAPRSRTTRNDFYWFCLDHVRAYNASWNFYAGMSAAEVEAEIRHDTVWQRPSWPLGARVGTLYNARWRGFGLFDLDEDAQTEARTPKRPRSPLEKAMALFDLVPPLTLAGLKARYKELVKRHHPDTHGGDKMAEERLKEINQAYSTLKASYFPT